jgi:pyruvate/2-oxoglutarate/acetoin dehydrogenase E1 component
LAVGLALRGMHPIAEIMFGDFITLAADQLINPAAKFPAMYNGQVSVPLVVRVPMGGRRGYGPTHSQSLERLFWGIPHLKIVAPSHVHDAGALLKQAVADSSPVLFVEYKALYGQELILNRAQRSLERHEIPGPDGYPTVVLRNYNADLASPDVTLIAYGGISGLLVPVLDYLAEEEINVLAYLPSLINQAPEQALLEGVVATGRVVIVEEGVVDFGWGADVAARIYARCFATLKGPIRRVGAVNEIIPATPSLENHVLVSRDSLIQSILEVLA